jgi:hypothetical protein
LRPLIKKAVRLFPPGFDLEAAVLATGFFATTFLETVFATGFFATGFFATGFFATGFFATGLLGAGFFAPFLGAAREPPENIETCPLLP